MQGVQRVGCRDGLRAGGRRSDPGRLDAPSNAGPRRLAGAVRAGVGACGVAVQAAATAVWWRRRASRAAWMMKSNPPVAAYTAIMLSVGALAVDARMKATPK